MTSNPVEQSKPRRRKRLLRPANLAKAALPIAIILVAFLVFRTEKKDVSEGTTFAVKRGPLRISVLERGTMDALEKQTLQCEVRGQTKILSIVDEGYMVTEEDIKNGKILVSLDSADLVERKIQHEIELRSAEANYINARESYGIQIKQNESDIKTAELDVKFARMDFEKYMGTQAAQKILQDLNLDVLPDFRMAAANASADLTEALGTAAAAAEASETPPGPEGVEAGPAVIETDGMSVEIELTSVPARPPVDFTQYADPDRLGDGEAQEQLRKLESDLSLAEQEWQLAKNTLEGTERLKKEEFVTEQELEADRMREKQRANDLEAARIAKDLFIKYEFPKQAEKLLADYEEAIRKLERTYKEAISKLAQAEAKWKSSEAQYQLQVSRLKEIEERIASCEIRAKKPGMVLYAGSNEPWRNERIEEGATVHERQDLITIPDMSQMAATVKVHESAIKRVKKGQKATIRVDAFPDNVLTGEVVRVSVLPDSGERWMNPDLKLYPCDVKVNGTHDWLKPGMSAEVDILVEELPDVLYVPVQAVKAVNGKRVCYRPDGTPVPVETGQFNSEYIEIVAGLEEGDRILLRAPTRRGEESGQETRGDEETPGEDGEQPGPEQQVAPEGPQEAQAPAAEQG